MRILKWTLQRVFEELVYFSSSREAIKPSADTTTLFGKSGQLARREILTSEPPNQWHIGLFDAARCVCSRTEGWRVNSRNANGLFPHLHRQLQAQALLSLVEEGDSQQAQGDTSLNT